MLISIFLFAGIGAAAVIKKKPQKPAAGIEAKVMPPQEGKQKPSVRKEPVQTAAKKSPKQPAKPPETAAVTERSIPRANRIDEFFNTRGAKFPIVETLTYRSRVPWHKGPAWLSDYATHFSTSRHFIARSLNGKPDYFKQEVAEGDRFNVLSPNKNIEFHLLVDLSRCHMWFYYIDLDTQTRVLVKDYTVSLGRSQLSSPSGFLTPLGKYSLGKKIAIYKPKMMGFHNGKKVEMIQVFGSRWIPFEKEISGTTAPAKGLGLHGVPWEANEKGELKEKKESLGKNLSDGCIRLSKEDIEELFAVVITKPTTIELVRDFHEAQLPGKEGK
jgi:hypothetical protein